MTTALALAPQADGFTVPDLIEPLEAWRVWRAHPHEGNLALYSAFADAPWEPGVPLSATCVKRQRARLRPWRMERTRHQAPDIGCSCGIYGVRSLAAARWYLETQAALSPADWVIGRVALWGDVVVSECGWRASTAYPLELFVPVPTLLPRGRWRHSRLQLDDVVFELEKYRVPVDILETDVALAV
jgi:hypothetical protein